MIELLKQNSLELQNYLTDLYNQVFGTSYSYGQLQVQPYGFNHKDTTGNTGYYIPRSYDTNNNGYLYVGRLWGSVYVGDGSTDNHAFYLLNYSKDHSAIKNCQTIGGPVNTGYVGLKTLPFCEDYIYFNAITFNLLAGTTRSVDGINFIGYKIGVPSRAITVSV